MKYEEIKGLTAKAIAQTLGETYMTEHGYLESIPADKLVDVGKDVTDVENTVEKFTKSLLVLLAKHTIDEGDFSPLYGSIMVDRIEWGGFVERTKIDFADIMADCVMTVTDGTDYSSIEHKFYQPKVTSKIYDEGKGIMIPVSIQRETLTEAFKSYDAMNSYISKIRAKVRQTLDLAVDRYAGVLVEAAIAISVKATSTAIYLLDEAIAAKVTGISSTTTPKAALNNPDYIKFCAKRISEVRNNFKACTTAYNNGSWATASNNNSLYLLNHYVSALKFDVKSGAFNKEEIGFGDYNQLPMWQSVKASSGTEVFEWSTASKVSFAADSGNKLGVGTDALEISDVLGVLFDNKALGITLFKEYTTSSYTACADFWNEFVHVVTNQIVDSDYPIVAFINGKA